MREILINDGKRAVRDFERILHDNFEDGVGIGAFIDGPDIPMLMGKDYEYIRVLLMHLIIGAAKNEGVDPVRYVNEIYHDVIDEWEDESAEPDDDESETPVTYHRKDEDCDNCRHFSTEEGCTCPDHCDTCDA